MRFSSLFLFFVFTFSIVLAQENDSSKVSNDTTIIIRNSKTENITVVDSNSTRSVLRRKKEALRQPTMPRMSLSDKQNKLYFGISNDTFGDAADKTNWDALNMPTSNADYEISREYLQPKVSITPMELPSKDIYDPLTVHEIHVPTRQELDILEVLWLKEDAMDITLYSCLDSTLNITMEDLNKLLRTMKRKGYVQRKLVSARNEFNAFGIMIEMSPQNIRNRIYSYHTNVDREVMKKFIDANAYLFKEDSSIVNKTQLKAARNDNTLLEDLNSKIYSPKNN